MGAHNQSYLNHRSEREKADPGNAGSIVVDRSPCVVRLTSAAAETRTLARPTKVGDEVRLHFYSDGGDITLTVTGNYDEGGTSTMTFTEVGQFAEFVAFWDGTNYFWRLRASSEGISTNVIIMEGATGENEIRITNNVADALSIETSAVDVLVFDTTTNSVKVIAPDDTLLAVGTGATARFSWDTTDANANEMLLQLPAGGATDVPVLIIGQAIESVDPGLYNGVVDPRVAIFGTGAVATGPMIEFRKARGTFTSPTVVTSGDDCGSLDFYGCVAAGEYVRSARILVETTGTIATTRGPGVITFQTATDAAPSVLTTAMTISAAQLVTVASGLTVTAGGATITAGGLLVTAGRIREVMTPTDVDAQNNTLTVAQIVGGIVVHTSVTGGGTVTTDTAVNIVAGSAGVGALTADGQCIICHYINDGTQVLTFAGDTGVTIADTGQTIGADEAAYIIFRRTSATTVVAYIVGA